MSNVKQVYIVRRDGFKRIIPLANPVIEHDGCIKTSQFGDLYPTDYFHSLECAIAVYKSVIQRDIDAAIELRDKYDCYEYLQDLGSGYYARKLKDLK